MQDILQGAKILVVEDNEDLSFLMSAFLMSAGAEVTVANDGTSALRIINDDRFQLVFMDIRLPDISGIDIVKSIRQAGIAVPVIACSAHSRIVFGDSMLSLGFDGYLSKPYTSVQTVETAKIALSKRI